MPAALRNIGRDISRISSERRRSRGRCIGGRRSSGRLELGLSRDEVHEDLFAAASDRVDAHLAVESLDDGARAASHARGTAHDLSRLTRAQVVRLEDTRETHPQGEQTTVR